MRFPALFAVILGLFSTGAPAGEHPPLADAQRVRLEEAFHLVERLGLHRVINCCGGSCSSVAMAMASCW